jgi:tripartite-type tricarboxylate transporter receptor subunit TctC
MEMKLMRLHWILALSLLAFGSSVPAVAATDEAFFKGKTIRFVVGYGPGGGYDIFTRAITRHLGRHIPGQPVVIVENMAGAGSLIAANYLYSKAAPDGLTVGNFSGGSLILQQIMGRPGVQFDARKFEWIGVPARDNIVCALTNASGITSAEQWLAAPKPVKLGGLSPGNATDDVPKILKTMGFPIQLVEGYRATTEIQLAAEKAEVSGGCWPWETIRRGWAQALARGDVRVVLQVVPKAHSDHPTVPLAGKFAKTKAQQELLQFGVYDPVALNRPYVLPPGTPKDRVETLRRAFLVTLQDPDFLAEAKKLQLDIDPIPGEQVQKIVDGFFKVSPTRVAILKDLLAPR